MNLATLESRAYQRLGIDNAAPPTVVINRVRGFINETYRELMGRKGFDQFQRQRISFATVVGRAITGVPQGILKIHSIQDMTNQVDLQEVSLTAIRSSDPALVSTNSTPYAYAIYHLDSPVLVQPPGSTFDLHAFSTSASDGAAKTIYVEGFNDAGDPVKASHTLNGASQVTLTCPVSAWGIITKCYIQVPATQGLGAIATAAGTIYLVYGVSDTILANIMAGRSRARYALIHLYPTPSAVALLYADVDLRVDDLVEEGDEPLLPENYHWLLSSGAIIKEYGKREKPVQASEERSRYASGLGELILYANRQPGRTTAPQRLTRWSQLGGWFPPGT